MITRKPSLPFSNFFKSQNASALIMIGCVALSLLLANLPGQERLEHIISSELGFTAGWIQLRYSVEMWINDGLMAIFFLLVGLEIKREVISGELSTFRKASLPILAAFGGAVFPAVIYFVLNYSETTRSGWGIPMATDIAFALAIITFLSKHVPPSLKIFLSALAIADDLFAILVIAVFYSSHLQVDYLAYAAVVVSLLIILNRAGVRKLIFYLVPGAVLWYLIHASGVHATIAGIVLAFTLPAKGSSKPSPLETLEHALTKPVNFIILPLFAFVNTAITIDSGMFLQIFNPLGLGILAGLLIGKPLGIVAASWLSVKTGISTLPARAGWNHIVGVGMLGGIGFTMSIFIALLSFSESADFLAEAKLFVLIGSVIAGVLGTVWLRRGAIGERL